MSLVAHATCDAERGRGIVGEIAAALHRDVAQGDASRPPVCERLPAGSRRARPARTRTACTDRPTDTTRHRTRSPDDTTPAAGSRTARISMCSLLSGDVPRGVSTHRSARARSCALRHASVSPASCVSPSPICRDVRALPGHARCLAPASPTDFLSLKRLSLICHP